MIDAIVKLAGSLFIGGIGLGLIFFFTMLILVLCNDFYNSYKEKE